MHPLPRREGKMQISEKHTEWNRKNNLYNFIYYYNFYICLIYFCLFSCCSLCNFLIRIPEDILNQEFLQTRALCKFSTEFLGCWMNDHSHIGDGTSHVFTTLAQMGIVSATLFLQSWLDIAQNPSSILSSPFGKMRDLHIR
jgi:hypothetical protein